MIARERAAGLLVLGDGARDARRRRNERGRCVSRGCRCVGRPAVSWRRDARSGAGTAGAVQGAGAGGSGPCAVGSACAVVAQLLARARRRRAGRAPAPKRARPLRQPRLPLCRAAGRELASRRKKRRWAGRRRHRAGLRSRPLRKREAAGAAPAASRHRRRRRRCRKRRRRELRPWRGARPGACRNTPTTRGRRSRAFSCAGARTRCRPCRPRKSSQSRRKLLRYVSSSGVSSSPRFQSGRRRFASDNVATNTACRYPAWTTHTGWSGRTSTWLAVSPISSSQLAERALVRGFVAVSPAAEILPNAAGAPHEGAVLAHDEDAGAREVAVGVDADVEHVVLSLSERRCGWVTRAEAGKRVVVQSRCCPPLRSL